MNFKFPYKIIKREEYEDLLEAKGKFIDLCKEKNIKPMTDVELLIANHPLFNFSTRLLLRRLKKEIKGG